MQTFVKVRANFWDLLCDDHSVHVCRTRAGVAVRTGGLDTCVKCRSLRTFVCRMPFTRSLKPAKLPPNTSLDGRSPNSKYWGKKYGLVTMCPHIKGKKQGGDGRQCGLRRERCMCLCPRCCTLF